MNFNAFSYNSRKNIKNYFQNLLNDLQTNFDNSSSDLSDLTTKVDDNKTSIDNLTTKVDDNKTSIDNLTTKVDDNKTSIDNLTTKVDDNKTSIDNLTTKVNAIKNFNSIQTIDANSDYTITNSDFDIDFRNGSYTIKRYDDDSDSNTYEYYIDTTDALLAIKEDGSEVKIINQTDQDLKFLIQIQTIQAI